MLAVWILVFAHLSSICHGSCYFSAELQGDYVMQTVAAGARVDYSTVQITAEAIPMWGQCHQRLGDNVILNDSFNGTACIRCFHLKLQSPNILQVHTCPTCLSQCYLSEEAARKTCPTGHDISHNKYKEITLFRTKELGGGNIRKMFCPITGRFSFTYNMLNQTDNRVECTASQSHLENCADRAGGPQLDVHMQGCSQQYDSVTFECLGDWAGPEGQRYLALMDTGALPGSDYRPQYRCALYKEDEQRGNVMMAFSSDSTCTTDLYNATYGHMTWNLTAFPTKPWPVSVTNSKCSFPHWSQGKWENFNVNLNSLMYEDHLSYNTYTMRCAQPIDEERFLVYSKNGCGEEIYKCIRLKHRSVNVLEFQLGLSSSGILNRSLCSDSNFLGNVWVTQARLEGLQVSPCPVNGEYSGLIPEPKGLCAQLASDQLHPEIMFFTVSDCEQLEVYEGRYRSGRYKRQDTMNVSEKTIEEAVEFTTEAVSASSITVSESLTTTSTAPSSIGSLPSTVGTDFPKPEYSSTDEALSTQSPLVHTLSTIDDSEQVESSMNEKAVDIESQPMFVASYNDSTRKGSDPREGLPITNRPYRSFQPQNQWTTPPPASWMVPSMPRSPYIPASTLPWYSINNNRNYSYPQMSTRTNYDRFPRPGETSYDKVPTDTQFRGYYPDNFRGSAQGGVYDRRDWVNRGRQLGEANTSYYEVRNNWSTGREGYINRPRPTASSSFPYRGDWNYQNPRQNWNWDNRYRSQPGFQYRPYQNTDPNYRQPIALPPIQLPPLFDSSRPVQGVSSIDHNPLVREEREYQCLGQWEEDGLTYTYTQRKDIGSYECFVGSIVSNNEIYIKEAGEHCGRGIDPRLGMKLQTKVKSRLPEPNPPPTEPVTSWYVTKQPSIATKPWKPITGAPPKYSGESRVTPAAMLLLASSLLLTLSLRQRLRC